jgi:hypothetical protein
MKGISGEFRKYMCHDCCLLISQYFNHFERPESFRVIECYHCHGKAELVEDNPVQELEYARGTTN